MSKGRPSLPAMTVNRDFMAEVMSADPPSFALGLVEIEGRNRGFLALLPKETIPKEVTDIGFSFGHCLLGPLLNRIVIQFSFHFYTFGTYHALINPNNPIVRTVLSTMVETQDYFFFLLHADKTATSFRSELGEENLAGLKTNLPLIRAAVTTDIQYHHALSLFSINPDPPGKMLKWICGDNSHALDPTGNPLHGHCSFPLYRNPLQLPEQHPPASFRARLQLSSAMGRFVLLRSAPAFTVGSRHGRSSRG